MCEYVWYVQQPRSPTPFQNTNHVTQSQVVEILQCENVNVYGIRFIEGQNCDPHAPGDLDNGVYC